MPLLPKNHLDRNSLNQNPLHYCNCSVLGSKICIANTIEAESLPFYKKLISSSNSRLYSGVQHELSATVSLQKRGIVHHKDKGFTNSSFNKLINYQIDNLVLFVHKTSYITYVILKFLCKFVIEDSKNYYL